MIFVSIDFTDNSLLKEIELTENAVFLRQRSLYEYNDTYE